MSVYNCRVRQCDARSRMPAQIQSRREGSKSSKHVQLYNCIVIVCLRFEYEYPNCSSVCELVCAKLLYYKQYLYFRIVLLCQEHTEGINDAIIKAALPLSDSVQRVTALNNLLKTVSLQLFS